MNNKLPPIKYFTCDACNAKYKNQSSYNLHLKSAEHKRKLKKSGTDIKNELPKNINANHNEEKDAKSIVTKFVDLFDHKKNTDNNINRYAALALDSNSDCDTDNDSINE